MNTFRLNTLLSGNTFFNRFCLSFICHQSRSWLKLANMMVVLATLAFANTAMAAPDVQVGTATAGPGQEVSIPVDFVTDGTVVALQYDLSFNSAVLSVTNVTSGSALDGHVFDWQLVAPGKIRSVVTTSTLTKLRSGRVANVRFRVSAAAAVGTENLVLTQLVLAQSNAGEVQPTSVQDGSITIAMAGDISAVPIPALGWFSMLALIGLLAGLGWLAIRRGPGSAMMSVFLGGILFSSTLVQAATLPGDANNDGNVNALDIPVIVAQILERATAPGNPDCNQDSLVNVLDTICAAQPAAENQPPVLTAIGNQQAVVNQSFSLTAVAADPDQSDVVTYSLDQAPAGMTIGAASGVIAWTPTTGQLGIHDVVVRATDLEGLFDVETFQINVVEIITNNPPTLIPPGNRQIQANTAFSTTLFATDPDAGDVLTFALVNAPAGMNIDPASGQLTWTPSSVDLGSNAVTASVTDSDGLQDTETFTVTVIQQLPVAEINVPPQLTVPGNQSMVLGNQLSVQASATDADNDPLVFELVSAPSGMAIDSANGRITWMPAAAQLGSHDVAVKVSDPYKGVDFGSFVVEVLKVNAAPVAVDDVYTVERGDTLTVPPAGVLANDTDPNDDALTASLVSNVSAGALSLNADGSFEYTPDNPAGTLDMKLKWVAAKTYGQPAGIPAIMDLDGDGIPEIMLFDHGTGHGVLRAVHGDTGEVYFNTDVRWNHYGSPGLAVADIDLDGSLETITVRYEIDRNYSQIGLKLSAFDHKGRPKWVSEPLPTRYKLNGKYYQDGRMDNASITIADIDQDGIPEILVGTNQSGKRIGYDVWDNQGNKIDHVWVANNFGSVAPESHVEVIDLDLDGDMEIIVGSAAWSHDGQLIWHRNEYGLTNLVSNNYPLSANLDDDPYPELVRQVGVNTYSKGLITAWNHDGTTLWVSEKLGNIHNFGMLSIADVDSDGYADVIAPGSVGDGNFYVLDGRDGTIKWSKQVNLGYGGAAVMDMDGDGFNEVVYMDEGRVIQVWDGRDGTDKLSYPTGEAGRSLKRNLPIFADVDGDGHAELIMLGAYALYPDLFKVYESINDDWPPMRAVWNQSSYHVTNINDDGTVPQFERPHWLLPGLNMNLSNQRLPEDRFSSTDSFTYKASDGALSSNTATVHLNVLPPNSPPQILSTPRLAASPGFEYTYGVVATDADVGETLTYTLGTGPSGMLMDANHIVHWTPGQADLGTHPVVISVTDSVGVSAFQNFVVTVVAPVSVPDVTGLNQASAEMAITDALLTTGTVKSAFSKDFAAGLVAQQQPPSGTMAEAGSQVNIIISLGAGPADTDNDGDGFTPNEGDCNDNDSSIHPGATDPAGDGIDQDCDGIDGNLTLSEILVLPADSTVLANQGVNLTATGIFEDGTSQNLTAIAGWSNGPQFSSSNPGTFTVTASRGGITGSATVHVVARTGDNTPPVAAITAPGNNTTVTEPVDIIGTASDDSFLKYELAYGLADSDNFTPITTSTTLVSNGILGRFDPTLLINDLYALRLTVFDTGGSQSVAFITLQTEGNQKVGNFTLGFTDLNIPMSGIPITVNRNYDSRDKGVGDFGVGWRLGLNTLRLRASGILGEGWRVDKSGLSYVLQPTNQHIISLTLANGQVEVFDLVALPQVSPIVPFPPSAITASYQARPGTMGRLASVGNNVLAIIAPQPGQVELVDDNSFSTYNPDRFKYTQPDGTEIVISRSKGVESVRDPSGNTLTISNNGISHSSGKSITFNRDDLGRIVSIVDPGGHSQTYSYDANSDLRQHADREGNITRFRYNRSHGLIAIDDPMGNQTVRNEYDDDGRLTASIDGKGNRIEYFHDLDARQDEVTDLRGNRTVYLYDEQGHVLKKTDADGNVTTFTYDAAGNILTTTDPLGNTTHQSYDAQGNVLSQTDPLGNTTTHTYNPFGNKLSTTDALGGVTIFEYGANGTDLIKQTDADGNITRYSHDAKGNVVAITAPSGAVTQRSYDSFGNQLTEIDAMGNTTNFVYDANGNRTRKTQTRLTASGSEVLTTKMAYDANGLQTSITKPDGTVLTVEYDAAGRKSAVIDRNGNRTEYGYDGAGNAISETLPGGLSKTRTHDENGNVTSMTDVDGNTTSFVYDALNQVDTVSYANGSSLGNTYDGNGEIISNTDALGNVTSFEFDAAGRKTKIIDAMGNETSYAFDANGNVLSQTDGNSNNTSYLYDALNRRTRTTFADGTFTTTSYDAAGNKTSVTDQAGLTTSFSYDLMGNLVAVTDALGQTISYAYDEFGNKVSQIDANGHETTWQYDKVSQIIKKTDPEGTSESWTYDAVGNIATHTDANGFTTSFAYDDQNRLLLKTFPDLTTEFFTYSTSGQKLTASNASGTTNWTYDAQDRVIRIDGPDGRFLDYSYDAMNNRTSVTTAAGTTTTTYDANNRPASITDADGKVTTYAYDPAGNRASTILPNGIETTYSYDALNRLTQLENRRSDNSLLSGYTYTLGPSGNRLQVTESNGRVVKYRYDDVYKLTQEDIIDPVAGNETIGYTYDAHGNRTSKTDSSGTLTYSYDANDRILSDGISAYTYDSNGNTISQISISGTSHYSYDFENQMISLPDDNVSYEYDPDGVRLAQTVNGVVTRYVVDTNRELAQVLEEQTGTGTTIVSYVYGDDLIAQNRNGTDSYYIYDGQMSTRALTNSAGSSTDSYTYDAFGVLLNSSGNTLNHYLYTGEQFDPNAGFYYLRARYYSPEIGRFTTADDFPADMFDPGTLHRYVYVKNNPVNLVDPSGQFFTMVNLMVTISIDADLQKSYVKMLAKVFMSSLRIGKCLIEPGVMAQNAGLALVGDPYLGHIGVRMMQMGSEMVAQGLQELSKTLNKEVKTFAEGLIPKIKWTLNITARVPKQVIQAINAGQKIQGYQKKLEGYQKKIKETTEKLLKLENFFKDIASGNQCGQLEFIEGAL